MGCVSLLCSFKSCFLPTFWESSWIPMGTIVMNPICSEYIKHLYLSLKLFGKPFVFLFLRKTRLCDLSVYHIPPFNTTDSDCFLQWFVMSLAKLNKGLPAIHQLYWGLLFGWTCLSNNYNSYKYFRLTRSSPKAKTSYKFSGQVTISRVWRRSLAAKWREWWLHFPALLSVTESTDANIKKHPQPRSYLITSFKA